MIHVLVALDLCEHSALTLEVAFALAQGARGRTTVLHVVRLPEEPSGSGAAAHDEWSRMKCYALSSAERAMDRLLSRMGLTGKVEPRVSVGGRVWEVISEEARGLGADLIVVGVHERPLLSRYLAGGAARRIQRRAHCPVVAVRSGAPEEMASRLKPRRALMRAEVLE